MLTFDITNDFIVGDRITKETLNKYSKLPHKIKAGLFLLCVEGSVQASINLAKYTINKYDFVTLVPSNFIGRRTFLFRRILFGVYDKHQFY